MISKSKTRILNIVILAALMVFALALAPAFSYAGSAADEGTEWDFAIFGTGTNTATGGFEAGDGNVRVYSHDDNGKLQTASTDGLSFYYTAIDPRETNFTLSARANINTWKYSNGQEGFGLMAADQVEKDAVSKVVWNNSYMAAVMAVKYYWDGEKVSNHGDSVSMKLGVAAQEKTGVTPDNITEDRMLEDMGRFSSKVTTLETSCAGNDRDATPVSAFNLAGNYEGAMPPGTVEDPLTSFDFTIGKNNTGYFVSYTDENGETTTQQYYDTEALNKIDPDHVYLGFFTSRNADVTFTDISLVTSDPEGDDPATERPVTQVDPVYRVDSAGTSNSSAYTLVYKGNADGTLDVKLNGETCLTDIRVEADKKTRIPTVLAEGSNTFELTVTPDEDYRPSEYEELASYDPVTIVHQVEYAPHDGDVIYVSPEGNAGAAGDKDDPYDIYSAVEKAKPGSRIFLMEGTYHMDRPLMIRHGSDGRETGRITLEADPEAAARPLLDFGGTSKGVYLDADYWHFKGFDVTGSKDLEAGINVNGSFNTLELMRTYKNGDTGIWLCAFRETDSRDEWPSNNLILNCTSMMNADVGGEDADGFAAKITAGDGNIFDGCVAMYNADDGFDLFAKVQCGPIGRVVIRNCVVYKNGYILDDDGNEISAGDGNGYKMGGQNIVGGHVLENSIAFANKKIGVNANSCPDITVKNCTFYDNESRNVVLRTDVTNSAFNAHGILSCGKAQSLNDNIVPKGTQDTALLFGSSNYYYNQGKSVNSQGKTADDSWFVSVDTEKAIKNGIARKADGSIFMEGLFEPTAKAPKDTGARIGDAIGGGEIQPPAPAPKPAPSSTVKAGTKYTNSQGTFKVTSVKKKTVSFTKAAKTKKTVTIPATVKIKGVKYTVTGIGSYAFKGTKAKTITIRTKKLTKKSVRYSLKSSKVSTVKVKVGSKKVNKSHVKKYKGYFTKKNAGKKVKVRIA